MARIRRANESNTWQHSASYLAFSLVMLIFGGRMFEFVTKNGDDFLRAFVHREYHEDVVKLAQFVNEASVKTSLEGDFDGDGTLDRLETEYVPREPLCGSSTSEMVYVYSGRTGDCLLAHACNTWMAEWCDDVDDNGTTDVLIEVGTHSIVLGRSASR